MPTWPLDALVAGGERLSVVGITLLVLAVARGCRGTRAGCRVAGSGLGLCRALDAGEGLFLDGHVGVEVDLGGFGVLVAEPEGDDGGVHPSFQE